jgi:hypothetical protein
MDDAAQIKQNVANFAYRDQGRWDELKNLFHPDGSIAVTWYSGPIDGFVEGSKKMAASRGAQTKHWIGASRVDIRGDRALCDTDVVIMARSKLAGIEVDITTFARFVDRFERRTDRVWRAVRRVAVYEKDRIDPVAPSFRFRFLYALAGFSRYPASYRHLAAGLVRSGRKLSADIIEAGSAGERDLLQDARRWLDGTMERRAAQ